MKTATIGALTGGGAYHVVIPNREVGRLSVGLIYQDDEGTWTFAHVGGHRRLEGFATRAAALKGANVLLPFIDRNVREEAAA